LKEIVNIDGLNLGKVVLAIGEDVLTNVLTQYNVVFFGRTGSFVIVEMAPHVVLSGRLVATPDALVLRMG
jgi:hypothetical protein